MAADNVALASVGTHDEHVGPSVTVDILDRREATRGRVPEAEAPGASDVGVRKWTERQSRRTERDTDVPVLDSDQVRTPVVIDVDHLRRRFSEGVDAREAAPRAA